MYILKLVPAFLLLAQPLVSALAVNTSFPSTATTTTTQSYHTAAPQRFRISLPKVSGPNMVGRVSFDLTDNSRTDPFADAPKTPRTIVLHVFYPAEMPALHTITHGLYMPPITAAYTERDFGVANGTLSVIQPNSCEKADIIKGTEKKSRNVIIFTPGLGVSPLAYQTYHEELASLGYVVVAIAHPYDDSVVEIPSTGKVVYGKLSPNSTSDLLTGLSVRTADITFTIDSLSKNEVVSKYIPAISSGFDVDSGVLVYGHSFGGSAAASALKQDRRVIGGYNLDGAIQGKVLKTGFRKPYVLMGTSSHNLTSDASWKAIWPKLKAFKLALILKGAEHLTFTDYSSLAEMLGEKAYVPAASLREIFGTIEAPKALSTVRAYLKGFADMVLQKKNVDIMKGPIADYPDVAYCGTGKQVYGNSKRE